MQEEKIARQWLQGLLDGDEAVNNDVFSSTSDVYFDRQVCWSTTISVLDAVFARLRVDAGYNNDDCFVPVQLTKEIFQFGMHAYLRLCLICGFFRRS